MDITITKQKSDRKRVSKGCELVNTKDGKYVTDNAMKQVHFFAESCSGDHEYVVSLPIKYILDIAARINKERRGV